MALQDELSLALRYICKTRKYLTLPYLTLLSCDEVMSCQMSDERRLQLINLRILGILLDKSASMRRINVLLSSSCP